MESDISWTPEMDENVLEIFFTASPDRGDHQNRMKDMWNEKFPQFRDRISGKELELHATNLIDKISHYERKLPSPWTPEHIRRLVELYYRTDPQQRNHEYRLKDSWENKFPELKDKFDKRTLRNHAKTFIKKVYDSKRSRGPYFEWTPSINKEVVRIYYQASPLSQKHEEKMKKLWDETFPQYKHDITSSSLRLHAQRLIGGRKRSEISFHKREGNVGWNADQNAEILHIFDQTDPSYRSHANRMHECWIKMNPELKHIEGIRLKRHARALQAAEYGPTEEEKERARMKFNRAYPSGYIVGDKGISSHKSVRREIDWTPELKKELLKIFYSTPSNEMNHGEKIRAKWDNEFSQYKGKISGEELRQYAIYLIQKLSHHEIAEIPHWTPEMKKKLLRIYFQSEAKGKNRAEGMRETWNREVPYFTTEGNTLNLHEYAKSMIDRLQERKRGRKPKFLWTPSIDKDVLEIYHKVPPNTDKQAEEMKALWDHKFPLFKNMVTAGMLRLRAEKLLEQKDKVEEVTDPEWTDELNAELLHIHNRTEPKKRSHSIKMHKCWTQLHPEMDHVSPRRLTSRLSHLNTMGFKPTDEDRKRARMKFDMAFPHGFKYKGKEVMNNTDELTTPYPVSRKSELKIGQFHLDDPSYSPVRHQEFQHDFDVHHQVASSSQWPQHLLNLTDNTGHHSEYGSSSSRSHDQHHPD